MIVSSTVENIPLNKALEYHDDFKALISMKKSVHSYLGSVNCYT